MKTAGFAKNIGVSNFTFALLDEAVKYATEPLILNQIEWHPFLDQSKVRAACAQHHMAVTAYSPIAQGKASSDKALALIGMHYRKSAAQVCLRYLLQEGAIVIPRTSKLERLSENRDVFDFALNDAEMDEIRQLTGPRGRLVNMGSGPEWD